MGNIKMEVDYLMEYADDIQLSIDSLSPLKCPVSNRSGHNHFKKVTIHFPSLNVCKIKDSVELWLVWQVSMIIETRSQF